MFNSKEYHKQWYQRNKERLKKLRLKNVENRRIWAKGYYYKNKDKIRAYQKEWKEKRRELIIKIFGNNCLICKKDINEITKPILHEIYGNPHPRGSSRYFIYHSDDFILLCSRCHDFVHFCMQYLKMTWQEIKERKVI